MPEEQVDFKITRYRTPKAKPTCAIDFKNGKVCEFLQLAMLGTRETCFFIQDSSKRKKTLERDISSDGEISNGYLMPFKGCPIWKETK